ncbi:uncharacterized protein B0T15DRAFT_550439 [Chaetomium strumarium]|uniref:Uncharacterized protein n=1 Tax=Chaetomium strumarium TaxID=1170767 RepID=A0AAJ0M4E6_9PEZI|nr:hypothetical protein B0T15DRAFT_550439 [Chaetomium strumarium]
MDHNSAGGCNTYYYCGASTRPPTGQRTKEPASSSRTPRKRWETAESRLRARDPDCLETHAGKLCTASSGSAPSWRRQGIEDGLKVYLKLLHLNHTDQQDVRDIVPPLYIRPGRDQEAYDFLKYWGLRDNDLGDKDQPFLRIKNADAYEGVEIWDHEILPLAQAINVLLIKIRLLIGIRSVQRMKAWKASQGEDVAAMSGAQVLDWLRDDLGPFCGDIFERAPEVLGDDALLDEKLSAVADQIIALLWAIKRYNVYFIAMLLNPEEKDFGSERTGFHRPGSETEARLAFMRTYSAWCETDGAIQRLRNIISKGLE